MIRLLLRPWLRAGTWWQLTLVATDLAVGTVTFTVVVILAIFSVSFVFLFPLAVLSAWLLFNVARVLAWIERSRISALAGVDLPDPVPHLTSPTVWGRFIERFRNPDRWKEIGYLLLRFPLGLLTTISVLAAWCWSAALVILPFVVSHLPDSTAKFGLFEVHPGWGSALAGLVGIVGLTLLAPWLTVAMATLDVATARWLLAHDGHAELEAQVTKLETSRLAAVDSAEAERRRIERDLHDGAQQRLVALAIDLGSARERLDEGDAAEARELVAAAHDEVKAALRELRDLVRGIHPVILEDRGLDAALSAVVARSPVPVSLEIDVARRPSPAVESTAYFVVAEALTNVARHSQATRASVAIGRRGDRLIIEVSDDGVGGAEAAAGIGTGTGLAGLAERVSSLGGWMRVMSPPGGPTSLIAEVPCA